MKRLLWLLFILPINVYAVVCIPVGAYSAGTFYDNYKMCASDLNTAFATKVPITTTVNGHALSTNITISYSDLGGSPPTFNQSTTGTAGGLTGTALSGDVTNSGNVITLNNTAATAGSYTCANVTVDAKGRVTSVANGSCTSTITIGGTPATGNLTKWSSASAVTNGDLSGDVTTSGTLATTVVKINGTTMSVLGTGILKNTTGTGVPSIAVAGDFPTLNQNTSGTAAGLSATLSPASGGTGIANNSASTLAISGNFGTTLTVSGTTAVTLPTSGTLATTANTLTAISISAANGVSGSSSGGTTPALTISLGAILPSSINGVTTDSGTYAVVTRASTDTMINKTLTTPVLTTPTVNGYTECTDTPTISAGAVTISNTTCTFHKLSLLANTTITLPTPVTGQSYTIQMCYGGVYTVTWAMTSGSLSWSGASAPTATSVNGKCDFYTFTSHDTSYTYGFDGGRNYSGS